MILPFRRVRLTAAVAFATLVAMPAGAFAQEVEVRGVNAIDFGSIDRQVDMALDRLPSGGSVTIETPTRARVRITPLAERRDLAGMPGGGECRAYRYDYTHADDSATLEIHGVRCRSPGGYWVMLGEEEIVRVRPRGGAAVATAPRDPPPPAAAAPASVPPAALQPPGPVGIPKPNPLVRAAEPAPVASAGPPATEAPAPEAPASDISASDVPAAPAASAGPEPSGGGRVVYPGGLAPTVTLSGDPDPDVVAGLQLLRYLPEDQPASAGAVGRALADFAADEGVPPDVAVLRKRLDEALSRNRMLVSCGRAGPGACLRVP